MDFQNAFWISGEVGEAAPDFRREFFLEDFVGAEITICGLGFFELYINGSKVSDDLLVPAWSNYEKRENRKLLYPLAMISAGTGHIFCDTTWKTLCAVGLTL